ncbi:hypothetical protein SRHO_G00207000 [Serrasalmus rhombeus]
MCKRVSVVGGLENRDEEGGLGSTDAIGKETAIILALLAFCFGCLWSEDHPRSSGAFGEAELEEPCFSLQKARAEQGAGAGMRAVS